MQGVHSPTHILLDWKFINEILANQNEPESNKSSNTTAKQVKAIKNIKSKNQIKESNKMKTNFANNPKKIEKEPLPSPNDDKSISGLGLLNSVKFFMLHGIKGNFKLFILKRQDYR